jgi:UDP-N-acetylmuramoyl-tripeptide--D-alanyl-D-alanine ligase
VSYPNSISNFAGIDIRTRLAAAILMESIMENISAGQVEVATGGTLMVGSRRAGVSGVSIDTRSLLPGDLFFAIRGPNNDGHEFISQALAKGASGAVVDYSYAQASEYPPDRILIRVQDTHQALKDLAAEVRSQWPGSLVGITGSMGKTTTKEFMTQILQSEFNVYQSPGNYNNLFGLPLSIFGLSQADHLGIFEMAMSTRGEIAEMCRIARPNFGVITNVAPVHLEFFSSIEDISLAKAELAEGLSADGTLVYNADDPLVHAIADRFDGNVISFGLAGDADIRVSGIQIGGLQETNFTIVCEGHSLSATIPLSGAHFVMNALPAVALARCFGMEFGNIVEELRHLHQAHMRGQVVGFREGFTLIDDSYNSNPHALIQMIDTLSQIRTCTRRILVAGEMLELGGESEALHYRCGVRAAERAIDIIMGIQGAAREIAHGAIDAGASRSKVHFFTEVNPATDFVSRIVQPGDLVLIKGSRGVRLEKMVEALRSHYTELSV